MSFVQWWPIYLGAAALALPVLVHLLTRPRPAHYPVSTLRFIREAIQQRRARHRLRDLVILSLRTLAIVLLAWAMARPLIGDRPLVSASDPGDAVRVVLLDVSQSMGAGEAGVQVFERARSQAAQYLAYRSGLRSNLIQMGASPRAVFEEPSTNFSALHDELARSAVRPERLNLQAALNRAAEMLSASDPQQRRELVVVSDFQRANWSAANFAVLPADTQIELESVAPQTPPTNLAVLKAGVQGRSAQGRDVRLEVEVGNFSPASRRVGVELTVGDATYRLEGLCPPGDRVTLTEDIVLRDPGWIAGQARLLTDDDALGSDNSRPFVLEVRPQPLYALVTRQPANTKLTSSFYLERALAPYATRESISGGRVARVDPLQLDEESLAGADLIVIDHPGKLASDAVRLLTILLRRGRAILYIASEPVDATNLKQLAEAAGSSLQMPVEFLPPAAGSQRRDLFLTEVKRDQSPFTVFGDDLPKAIGMLRFSGGLASRRLDGALADDVLASFSDRSTALVVTSSGAGMLAVLNADLGSSNLTGSTSFVPLLNELVERLLGRGRRSSASASGEPLAVYLPSEAGAAAGLHIATPSGETITDAGELVEESLGILWRSPAAGPPGIYQVRRGGQTVFSLATEVPAEESDLRPLEADVLKQRLAGGRKVHFRSNSGDQQERDDLWTWLAVSCVVCMLAELTALRAYRT